MDKNYQNPKLILVDYENIQKVDLSVLDESFHAIIFVGAKQNPPKIATKKEAAHRFKRVDFQKIHGSGKNALDFHIAFHLGRVIETSPKTECFVLSKDKGFDSLLLHLNNIGLQCSRITSLSEIAQNYKTEVLVPEEICGRCGKASTIEHYGGHWCSNCGGFAKAPDPSQLPSMQANYVEPKYAHGHTRKFIIRCGWCYQEADIGGGIYDDGEWMCGECISQYAR